MVRMRSYQSRQPLNPILSGYPFKPQHVYVLQPGRGTKDLCQLNDLVEIGGPPIYSAGLDRARGYQFDGATQNLETTSITNITTYPLAMGAVFSPTSITTAGDIVGYTDRQTAATANFFELFTTNTGILQLTARQGGVNVTFGTFQCEVGKTYTIAAYSFSATFHSIFVNGRQVNTSTTNAGAFTGVGMNAICIGGGRRNTVPQFQQPSTHRIAMAWFGMPYAKFSGTDIQQWTKEPWKMFRSSHTI